MIAYLVTVLHVLNNKRVDARNRLAQGQDAGWRERGSLTVELAIIATVLVGVAIGLAALITSAVSNHSASIK